MAIGSAQCILLNTVVKGQLKLCLAILIATAIANKCHGVFLLRSISRPQEIHSHNIGVKPNRPIQVTHTQHRVQDFHTILY
jgi:hypothetical protein